MREHNKVTLCFGCILTPNCSQQRGATVSFSNAEQSSSVKKETKQMQSFQEVSEVSEVQSIGTPFQQAGFKAAPLQENLVAKQQSAGFAQMSSSQQSSSSQQMASSSVTSQKSMMSSSSSSSKSVSMQSSSTMQKVRPLTI